MTKTKTLALSLDVLALSADGQPPAEFRLFAPGVNETSKGPIIFDESGATKVLSAYQRRGIDVVIDYEHQAVAEPPVEAPAAGWLSLEARGGELWATNVRWNERAAGQLARKEYRYFSPTLFYEEVDHEGRVCKRPTMLLTVSLTNAPAMEGLPPLVASARDLRSPTLALAMSFEAIYAAVRDALREQFEEAWIVEIYDEFVVFERSGRLWRIGYAVTGQTISLEAEAVEVSRQYLPVNGGKTMKTVLTALGLKPDATEAEALSALSPLTGAQRDLFALTEKSTLAEALGVIQGWKQNSAQAEKLSARVQELEREAREGKVEAMLDAAENEGKVVSAEREVLLTIGRENPERLQALLSVKAKVVPLGTSAKEPQPKGAGTIMGDLGDLAGKKWEELAPIEKHNLFTTNPAAYVALKTEHEARAQ